MPHTQSAPHIHYALDGHRGPTTLMIMGLGMRGAMWRPQIDGLASEHRVATFDHRGIGKSARVGRRFTLRDLATDALRVLDDLGWNTAHVAGVSMGGMVAQELALAAPERVRSLTLIATHAGGPLGWVPTMRGLGCLLRARIMPRPERARALTELLYPAEYVASCDGDALERRMASTLSPLESQGTLLGQLRAVALHDTRRRLHELSMPTLVVRPGKDVLVPPHRSDDLASRMPKSRVVRLDHAGHGVAFQCAEALNDVLRRHIADAERLSPDFAPREGQDTLQTP